MYIKKSAFSLVLVLGLFINLVALPFGSAAPALAASLPVVDDFEAGLPAGKDANNNSIGFNTFQDGNAATSVAISTSAAPPAPVPGAGSLNNVLKMDLNVVSFAGFTHSFEDTGLTTWITQDWSAYEGFSFWLYGNNSGTTLFVDVLDNRNPGSIKDDAERWSINIPDNVSGWHEVKIPFASLHRKEIGNGAPNDGLGLSEVNGWALGSITTTTSQTYYVDNAMVYGVAPVKPLTVGFSTINYAVTEGATATITAKLSKPSNTAVTVDYATGFGTAIPNRDYTPVSAVLTFPPNITQQSFTISTIDDQKYQGERGLLVTLTNPTGGAALGLPAIARLAIQDNEDYYPPLLEDFETYPYLWTAFGKASLSNPEIAAGTPLALPGQGTYEHILQVSQQQAPSASVFSRVYPTGQNWGASSGLSFWYYGQNSKKDVTLSLTNNLPSPSNPSNWRLMWSDEFNGKAGTAPNPNVWGQEVGDGTVNGIPGWGNDELEYYTGGTANVATDGKGSLVITTKKADGSLMCYYGPCQYTSARLLTQNRFEAAYGRVEARIKVAKGAGLWPAFWMLGTDINQVGWPQAGEIDIMENVGRLPNQVFGTLHGPGYSGGQSYGGSVDLGTPVGDAYHVFAVEWQPDKVVWTIDGKPYFTATPNDAFLQGKQWVFNHPFYLLMNVAVGGNFAGAVGADTTFPQTTSVDYVRIYQAIPKPLPFVTTFRDNFNGWKQVSIPFSAFKSFPGTSLDLSAIQSLSFVVPGGMRSPVRLDQIRLKYADVMPPTVAITSSGAGGTVKGPVTFSFTFSEDVGTSFTANDISVIGGIAGTFTRVNGTLATLVVTPPVNSTGTIDISVAAGKFFDAAFNANTASASASQAYDTTVVTVSGLPITFDDPAVVYTLTGFGGTASSVVTDPAGGTNRVAQVIKTATAELWAGTTISTGPNFSISTIPFSATAKTITMRVWAPAAGIPIRLKVEDAADPTHSCETEALTSLANAWETLSFDFANPAAGTAALNLAFTFNKVSVFPNFGKTGAQIGADTTYIFDDLTFAGGTPPPPATWNLITFDDPAVVYTLTGFGGADDSSIVFDPAGGTNKAAKVVKSATAELWAGTTVSTGANFSVPTLPFTASSTKMTVRVYSPDAGIQVRLKVEDALDPTKSVETEATTTLANTWETLTFDFANQAAGTAALNLAYTYNKVSIFFNFGVTGAMAGAKTYYFDDVVFMP
jgi:beta-glucanase (GH16 family)